MSAKIKKPAGGRKKAGKPEERPPTLTLVAAANTTHILCI